MVSAKENRLNMYGLLFVSLPFVIASIREQFSFFCLDTKEPKNQDATIGRRSLDFSRKADKVKILRDENLRRIAQNLNASAFAAFLMKNQFTQFKLRAASIPAHVGGSRTFIKQNI